MSLAEFKRNDVHPRRQRHYLLALKRLQVRLVTGDATGDTGQVPPLSHSASFTSPSTTATAATSTATTASTTMSAMDAGSDKASKKKMRTRDIDLPFKRASQGSKVSSRINALLSKKKSRHSPTGKN